MDKVIDKIATDVKAFEEHQKAVRLDTVKSYLANKAAEYMLDPRLFDEKALEYIKVSDFMADGVTLKKVTMKSLEDMVTFEYQKQQEHEKEKAAISGQCAEYGMTDQPYIRMLQSMSLADVMQQIMSDYLFESKKSKNCDKLRPKGSNFRLSNKRNSKNRFKNRQKRPKLTQRQARFWAEVNYTTPTKKRSEGLKMSLKSTLKK